MAATATARRQALADFARSRKREGGTGRVTRRIALVMIVLCLLGLAVAWFAGFFTTPQDVVALRAAVDTEIAQLERMAKGEIPYSEGNRSFGSIMDVARKVPDQYRDQEMSRFFRAYEAAEISSYFALPPDQRAAELDRRIKAEEARRARWEAERQERATAEATASGGAGSGQASGAPQGGRRVRVRTEETRNAWVKRYIDRTSADGRARRTEYRRAKDQRKLAMGIAPRR